MAFGLRAAQAEDRPALVDLWVAAWQVAWPTIPFASRRRWFEERLDGLVASGARIVVAEADRAPVGFLTVDPVTGALDQLAVDPANQGLGIASALIEAAKALAPGGLTLTVNRDNRPARRLYARHGFVERRRGTNPLSGLPTLDLTWNTDAEEAR